MKTQNFTNDVFINCPFDAEYKGLLDAIVFTVFDCGFRARCALEGDDGGNVRIEKIKNIIYESKYGIHDISRTELTPDTQLPRFNMPLELGLFLGAKKYGTGQQTDKKCLIMDREPFRYQKFISDIAGQDIKAHNANVSDAITIVRNWLGSSSRRKTLPGGRNITRRYAEFRNDLPQLCENAGISEDELTFNDFAQFVSEWLIQNTR